MNYHIYRRKVLGRKLREDILLNTSKGYKFKGNGAGSGAKCV